MARPRMRRLMEESGETVNLYFLEEGEAVCMAQVESRQMMRAIARPGGRVAMHCSGVGKALLAWLPEREVGRVLERHGLPRITEQDAGHAQGLARRARADARPRLRRSTTRSTRSACAASRPPSSTSTARPLAGVSVSGPTARIPDHRLALWAPWSPRRRARSRCELGGRLP